MLKDTVTGRSELAEEGRPYVIATLLPSISG